MRQSGFTIVELIIVLALLALTLAWTVSPFIGFRDTQVLQASIEEVLSTLAKARTQTLAGNGDSAYGVHLESSRLVLFAGPSYNAADPANEVVTLNSLVTISNINLAGGGSNVLFRRLTGATSQSGTVTLEVANNASTTKVVTIGASGIASAN